MYLEKQGTITDLAKADLASFLFTNHIRQALINFMLQGQGRCRWPWISFVDRYPIVIFVLDVYPVHSENVVHGDLHPVCTVVSSWILHSFISLRQIYL
jgi:hypothetical protein